MRDVKFRAWDKFNENMTYSNDLCDFFADFQKLKDGGNNPILMQFTGIKDREGNDIYEGDLLEFDKVEWGGGGNIFPVTYNEKDGEWCTGGGSNSECSAWKKIIGNIHETPKLLRFPV